MSELLQNGIFMQWFNNIRVTISPVEWIFLITDALLLIYYLIKGTHKERIFFVITSLMYIVLVLNPISCMILEKLIGDHFSIRVYRFYWAFPIYFVFAYFMTKLLIKFHKHSVLNAIITLVSIATIVLGVIQTVEGVRHTFFSDRVESVDNIYKIEDGLIQLVDIIEEDKKEKAIFANVISDNIVDRELRAYDASLIKVDTAAYFNLYSGDYCGLSQERMISVLDKLEVNYIIVSTANVNNDFLLRCGYERIGETSDENYHYYVYRIKEIK